MKMTNDQIVLFKIGDEYFGIDVLNVCEILRMTKIMPIPDSPPWVAGAIDLRGMVVDVIDFRQKFGYQPRVFDSESRIIIVTNGSKKLGIIVDNVRAVEYYDTDTLKKVDENSAGQREFMIGVITQEDKLISLLDFSKLF